MSELSASSALSVLREQLRGKDWILIGVGNPWREDDGAGSLLARRLSPRFPDRVFDGGLAPEKLDALLMRKRPEAVLLVDAARWEGLPGALAVLPLEGLEVTPMHGIPLPLLAEVWQEEGIEVHFLGIRPERLGGGEGISSAIEQALVLLEQHLALWLSEPRLQQNLKQEKGSEVL